MKLQNDFLALGEVYGRVLEDICRRHFLAEPSSPAPASSGRVSGRLIPQPPPPFIYAPRIL
jgi:hypothetical protein